MRPTIALLLVCSTALLGAAIMVSEAEARRGGGSPRASRRDTWEGQPER